MRKGMAWAIALLVVPAIAFAQNPKQVPNVPAEPPAAAPAGAPTEKITLDDAIRLAVQHNHALQAMRTTILQNQDLEVTANLRPNPTLSWDAQFLPFFQPNDFTSSYIDNNAQFDIGVGYLFERGKKRQHRLQAAKDNRCYGGADSRRRAKYHRECCTAIHLCLAGEGQSGVCHPAA